MCMMAENLQNYELQLQQVEAAPTSEPNNEELIKLKNDLEIQDYEDLLEQKVGQFGIGQAIIVFLICMPVSMVGPVAFFSQAFLSATPDHWCFFPELASSNLTVHQQQTMTIPQDSPNSFSQCEMYDVNITDYLRSEEPNGKTHWKTVKCKNGWVYDTSTFKSTIVTDFDFVCGNSIYPTIANSVGNFGIVFGAILLSWISDKFGRKKAMVIGMFISILTGIPAAFAPEIFSWMFFRMLYMASSVYYIVYVYVLELVGKNVRGFMALVMSLCYAISMFVLCFFAYFIENWRPLSLVISAPNIILLFALWFVPESPRWLLSKRRLGLLRIVLLKLAKMNGKKPFDFDLTQLKSEEAEEATENKAVSFFDLFKVPNMRKKMVILIYINFISAVCYFGLTLFSPVLGSNKILNFCLSSAVEIPGYFFGLFLMERLGRKWTTCITFVVGGIAAIISLEITSAGHTVSLVIFLFSKLWITANFMPILPFTSELLPTPYRNIGLGVAANIGILGTTLIPFLLFLGEDYLKLPLVIMGALSVTAGFLSLALPETANQPLPETLEDAENVGKDMRLKDYIRCFSVKNGSRNRIN